MSQLPKIKYLNNKELLSAIHESKNTFCEFVDKKYENFDIIAYDLISVTPDMIDLARQKKLNNIIAEEKKASGLKNFESSRTIDEIFPNEIVVRLMTFDHIPINPLKADKAKTTAEKHIRCNFPPFQHYIFQNDSWICVGKSHTKNGEFSLTHGRVTNRLGSMWMKLTERYGHRGNWRGYSYVDEMKSQALVQLSQVGLQFDESRSNNPFSYLTQVIHTSFLKILSTEKRTQNIRDDLLIMSGSTPSHTRQVEDQIAQQPEDLADMPIVAGPVPPEGNS